MFLINEPNEFPEEAIKKLRNFGEVFFKDNKYHILIKSHPADPKNKFGKSNQKFSYIEKPL